MGTPVKSMRLAVVTAIAGTIAIALGAFWLSFTALADLARRSGISVGQAWAWPLIVDGIIVVATVAVVALAGRRAAWYPWVLLAGGALVSVTANAIHAVVTADADVPEVLAAAVAAVPPLVLLAITHLTVILTRTTPWHEPVEPESPGLEAAEPSTTPAPALAAESSIPQILPPALVPMPVPTSVNGAGRRVRASALREAGWSNKRIARELAVHPSTVGRWFAPAHLSTEEPRNDPPVGVEEEGTP